MSLYCLTPSAIDDIDQAISYLASQAGWTIALKVEQELFGVFEKLATFPGLGHRRRDLTSLPLHFFPPNPTSSSTNATQNRSSFMPFFMEPAT